MNRASRRTRENLKGVNHKLIAVVGYALAISEVDFWVNEGLRTTEKQQEYFRKGTSKLDGITKKSNHQLGRAVDIYYVGWKNTDSSNDPRWKKLRDTFELAGKQLGVNLVFGYDWGWDKPHIELAKGE